ncbi:MAG: saccharopine dehydrogenase family protein [Promethearchaeota archaeon]
MGYIYGVLGAGRQGTAAAYDMGKWGEAEKIKIGDLNLENAKRACERVNDLLGANIGEPCKVDVTNKKEVISMLKNVDSFLSAVPYYYNLDIAKWAIEAGASMCDLGGNTNLVMVQLKLDSDAKRAGISIVPDCGQVPGMGTSLCVHAMSLLDEPQDVYMLDGGLPQNPKPPFNYILTFNIEGLTNEYAEPTIFIREGKLVEIQPLEELEEIEFPSPIGKLEAFTTGGGTSTAPYTFKGKLRTYQNKTLRYPGHYHQLRAYWDLGLFDLSPVMVNGKEIVPRDVFHALFEPKVVIPGEKDVVIIRIKCCGKKGGKLKVVQLDLIDYYDEQTGFTAMERTTGWDASIVAILMARGKIAKGAIPVEIAIPGNVFIEELIKRGFEINLKIKD